MRAAFREWPRGLTDFKAFVKAARPAPSRHLAGPVSSKSSETGGEGQVLSKETKDCPTLAVYAPLRWERHGAASSPVNLHAARAPNPRRPFCERRSLPSASSGPNRAQIS